MGLRLSIVVALLLPACSLIGTGDLRNEADGGAGVGGAGGNVACGECEDDNPCTIDACEALGCTHQPLSMELPNDDPTDCVSVACVGGVLTTMPDDSETPTQTASPCQISVCTGGEARTDARPDGTVCGRDLDVCLAGVCGHPCGFQIECPDVVDPCVRRIRCEGDACIAELLDAGDEANDEFQINGDCQELLCAGSASAVVIEYDSSDEASDDSSCTIDTCVKPGSTTHTPVDTGTPCEGGGVCRSGLCGVCLSEVDCDQNYFGPKCLAPGHCGCTAPSDCPVNRYCDPTNVCSTKKPSGASCMLSVECLSGMCTVTTCL